MPPPNAEHIDRYNQLPQYLRDFLEGLREEEVEVVRDAVRLMVAKRVVGVWGKARIALVTGTFIGIVALLQGWKWIREWLRGTVG